MNNKAIMLGGVVMIMMLGRLLACQSAREILGANARQLPTHFFKVIGSRQAELGMCKVGSCIRMKNFQTVAVPQIFQVKILGWIFDFNLCKNIAFINDSKLNADLSSAIEALVNKHKIKVIGISHKYQVRKLIYGLTELQPQEEERALFLLKTAIRDTSVEHLVNLTKPKVPQFKIDIKKLNQEISKKQTPLNEKAGEKIEGYCMVLIILTVILVLVELWKLVKVLFSFW